MLAVGSRTYCSDASRATCHTDSPLITPARRECKSRTVRLELLVSLGDELLTSRALALRSDPALWSLLQDAMVRL